MVILNMKNFAAKDAAADDSIFLLKQAFYIAFIVNINAHERGLRGKPRHGGDVAAQGVDKARAGGKAHIAHRQPEAFWRALESGVVGERILGLGHAHGQVSVALRFQLAEFFKRGFFKRNAVRAVDFLGDGLYFLR